MDSLTEEELATLILMTRGDDVSRISELLRMKIYVARGLANRVCRKLGFSSRCKAAAYGRDIEITRGLFA
jgi:DNA-binding CsgD family transcriptional regulator